jgi:cytidylate kinase
VILAEIVKRDTRDAERSNAPMRAAADALYLDTTCLSIDDAFAEAVRIVERQFPEG